MIKVVKSIDAYHADYVAEEVDDLQEAGYEVYEIKRVGRMFLMFGTDITHIYYREKPKQ